MNAYVALLLGLALAAGGGEVFVRGTVGLARAMRIPPGIVAATVAAFATSSPELTVALNSALDGTPELALGNALGANVVNVALILGLVLLSGSLTAARSGVLRDFPAAIGAPAATGALLWDGQLGRADGFVLLTGFALWLAATVRDAHKGRAAAGAVLGEPRRGRAIVDSASGLAMLIAAGMLIVHGAEGIATAFGLSEYLIGATIVALGTTAPELATALVARLKGHDEVGIGTVLGSNIFNGLFVVGLAASIHPIETNLAAVLLALLLGVVALAVVFPPASGVLARWRGAVLLAIYVLYLAITVETG